MVRWPLKAMRRAYLYHLGYNVRGFHCFGGLWDSLFGVGMLCLLVLLADRYVPDVHAALRHLPPAVYQTVDSAQKWCDRQFEDSRKD
jgi:hypothetical protein